MTTHNPFLWGRHQTLLSKVPTNDPDNHALMLRMKSRVTLTLGYGNKKGEISVYVNLTGGALSHLWRPLWIGLFIQENNLKAKRINGSIVNLGNIEIYGLLIALVERGWVDKLNLVLSEYTIANGQKAFTGTFNEVTQS